MTYLLNIDTLLQERHFQLDRVNSCTAEIRGNTHHVTQASLRPKPG